MGEMGSTETIERVEPRTSHGGGDDHERFAHYANKSEIMRAYLDGVAITALCGKKWRPQRDPSRYPICPTCQELYGQMRPGDDDGAPER